MDKLLKKENELLNEFNEYVKDIYNHPEIGNQEFRTSKLLANILIKYGFKTKVPNLLKTDFLGVYNAKKSGPKIAYLCEYDALPEIGHGCGHNLIGVISILAAIMLKEVIEDIGGSIYVFGCPAEENYGGKVELSKLGAFDDVDVALMLHPSSKYSVGGKTLAIIPIRYTFHGKSAHGCRPEDGKNALDGAINTYVGINMLRQYLKPGCYIHGVISNGGKAANVIPDLASIDYYFRAPSIKYADYIRCRATKIAKGAAQMSDLKVEETIYESIYEDKKINYTLAKELKKIYYEMGIIAEDVNETPSGSSDIGAVSYKVPTIEGTIKICDDNICAHSKEFASATISKQGQEALKLGALALAKLGYNLICDKELLSEVKNEFKESN